MAPLAAQEAVAGHGTLGRRSLHATGMAGVVSKTHLDLRLPSGVTISMYRVALITLLRALLMTIAVVAVGVASFLIASIVLEWL
jgi:hypothetical protein